MKEQLDKFVADAHERGDVYIIVPGAPGAQNDDVEQWYIDTLDPVSQSKGPELYR